MTLFPLRAMTLTAVLACTLQADAAAPDAGRLLHTLPAPAARPAAAAVAVDEVRDVAEPGGRFFVRGFEVLGASRLGATTLQALLAPELGRELALSDVHAAAERIAQACRAQGLALASAHVPPQEVHDGIVRIVVLEGRLGRLAVRNASRLGDATVQQALAGVAEGAPLDLAQLERLLLLLGDRPGVTVSSTLRPGASVGTSDLDVQLEGGRQFDGEAGLDNHGQRHTGRWRVRTELRGAGLLADGDSASLALLSAGTGLRHARLAYQLAPASAPPWRLGAAVATLRYRLGGELAPLQAQGEADSATAYLLHNLVRSRTSTLQAQLAVEHKRLVDLAGAGLVRSARQAQLVTFGLSAEHADGWLGGGAWQGALSLSSGRLALDDATAALDAAGAGTQGHYTKLSAQLARQQVLGAGWEGLLRLQAQASGQNLDGSEKLALGGPAAVRALAQGDAACDMAWLAAIDLRHRWAGGWVAGVFADAGRGHGRRHALPGESNRRQAAGHGLALEVARGDWQLSLQAAWTARLPGRDARVWAQTALRFP